MPASLLLRLVPSWPHALGGDISGFAHQETQNLAG